MILKLFLLTVYLFLGGWVCLKWRKCKYSIAGNEINCIVFPLVPVLLIPGSAAVVAFRILTCSMILGYFALWSNLLSKAIKEMLAAFGIMWGMTAFVEAILVIAGNGDICDGKWYMLLWYMISIAGLSPFILKRDDSRFARNAYSLNKIGRALSAALPFFILSSGGGLLLLLCNGSDSMAYVIGAVAGVMPLVYMIRNMPACMRYRELEEMKKKAYILGRGIKDGQLMGEEYGLVNETLVEDVRIIYNLMNLFEREKLYRNVDVKIQDVARMIGTNKSYLSRALNTRVSKNFCQFVNYYRVKEICTMFVEDPSNDVRSICEQCGFSSQSNFSIVFKYNTGHTPGDWCRMIKSRLEKNEPVQVDDYLL